MNKEMPNPRWRPTDPSELPNSFEKKQAQKTLAELEADLEEALKRVQDIKADIAQIKDYLAPVRRLNADVLRLIVMEVVTNQEWGDAAISCSLVCRFWGKTILNAPEVWSKFFLRGTEEGIENLHLHRIRARNSLLRINSSVGSEFKKSMIEILKLSGCIKSLIIRLDGDFLLDYLPSHTTIFTNTNYLAFKQYELYKYSLNSVELFGILSFPNLTTLVFNNISSIKLNHVLPMLPSLLRLHLFHCSANGFQKSNLDSLQELFCDDLSMHGSEYWNFPNLTRLRLTLSRPISYYEVREIRAPKLRILEYTKSHPPNLVGEMDYLNELHVSYQFGRFRTTDPIWSRPSVTSITFYSWENDCEDLIKSLNDLPPSLKTVYLRRAYGCNEELPSSLIEELEKKGIVVTVVGRMKEDVIKDW